MAWCLTGALLAAACGGSEQTSEPGDAGSGGSGVVLDGGGEIPNPPDGKSLCAPGVCNYQTQDCAAGQSCLPSDTPPASGDWPPKCFAAGSKAAGETCSQWNECSAGLFCAGVTPSEPGTCRRLCCGGDWSACPDGQSCFQQLYLVRPGGGDPVYASADLCAPVNDCDVFDASSCPDGTACQIVDPTGNVACITAGSAGLGDPCSPSDHCQAGFSCVAGSCRRLCRAVAGGGEPSCPAAEGVCVHFHRDPPGVGECSPSG